MIKHKLFLLVFCFAAIHGLAQENKDEFKPSGKVVSQVFGDYYFVAHADTGILNISNSVLKKQKEFNAFTLRRANLGYDYNFTQKFSALIRIEADESAATNEGKNLVFLKDARLKWNAFKNHDVLIGLQSTFSFEVSEQVWGHRHIEKTIMDLRKAVCTRDFGISLRGKVFDKGKVYYNVMVANNSFVGPETDKYKRGYLNIGYKPTDSSDVVAYADYNRKMKTFVGSKEYLKDEIVAGLFAGVKKSLFAAGCESYYKYAMNGDIYPNADNINDTAGLSSVGVSVFGSLRINKIFGVVARYDFVDYNIRQNAVWDYRHYIIAGLTWNPVKEISISPNLIVEMYEKTATRKIDPSVWPRLTFSWMLK
ncbi:MAG: hypothetical protein HY958_12910 [Bacteroidia bacterium]|nr:hypothetical protein [Bacteroidia bacterium]